MTTATTTAPLTTLDLLALRTCESVSFHGRPGGVFEINAFIEAVDYSGKPKILGVAQQNAFNEIRDERSRRRTITVNGAIRGYHGEMSEWISDGEATAFAMITSAQYETSWRTTAAMLRTGDTLSLPFVADNNNGYIRDAGLHVDTAHLFVERPVKDAQPKRYAFHLVTTITLDNSARMIKRHGA